ncbi:hypothetical protein [Sphingomonas sp. SRS2]|uniref:hypothetical protein n=1 Tax=Sphingomonas sp. SRS2 TaxID=133190 RepID=UPI0006184A49|nr:hypothetical protein [Sphingomonas sp. SRS2]KKC24598.1 hypothetical protein WP12_18400 [Sphingomonas sp. SRS2]
MTMSVQIRAETEATTPTLSALEWKVVSLAMREAESGIERPRGWLSRWIEGSTGIRPKLPLADPRLETLRRFVARVRARADASDLNSRLVEFGFHPSQISAVALIAR